MNVKAWLPEAIWYGKTANRQDSSTATQLNHNQPNKDRKLRKDAKDKKSNPPHKLYGPAECAKLLNKK